MDVGSAVPKLAVLDQRGEMRPLLAPPNRWRVVFFYPKDSTPGCTTENREFTALAAGFAAANAELIGVSRDSVAAHQRFCAAQGLVHTLISDDEGELCTLFDVIKEKSLYGRRFLGIERSTFLLDPAGVVRQAWRKVKVAGHAAAVLDALRSLQK